jgi:hypothetical protein
MIKIMVIITVMCFIGFNITIEKHYLLTDQLSMFICLIFSSAVLGAMIGIYLSYNQRR